MVQNVSKPRGRPRGYSPEAALGHALLTFWKAGFSATSLDDLSAAMGMNRPSLYAAFGDKKSLYLKAIALYWERSEAQLHRALRPEISVTAGLREMTEEAISSYVAGDVGQRGCFMIGTAVTEAVMDSDIRTAIYHALDKIEAAITVRFDLARQNGETGDAIEPATLGHMAADMLYGLALRARLGWKKAQLADSAATSIAAIVALASQSSSTLALQKRV